MDALTRFRRLFRYDAWANGEVLAALAALTDPPARATRLLAHIVAARRLWLARLEQQGQAVEVWPITTLGEISAGMAPLDEAWERYLDRLTPDRLDDAIEYRNTKGEPWSNTVADVLMHVAMHGTYHRGQIAADLRAAGHTPPYTDFIHAVRQGRISG